jgi:hypothetical protein
MIKNRKNVIWGWRSEKHQKSVTTNLNSFQMIERKSGDIYTQRLFTIVANYDNFHTRRGGA